MFSIQPPLSRFRVIALIMVLPIILGAFTSIGYAAPSAEPTPQIEVTTPVQDSLLEAISARQAQGLPVPRIEIQTQARSASSTVPQPGADNAITVTSTTTLIFDGPEQAGYDSWPALVVEDNLPAEVEGAVLEGDYTEAYRTAVEEAFPGFWDQYEFGQEPRTRTITETMVITYAEPSASNTRVPSAITSEDILLGFTYNGLDIDYTIGDDFEICDPFGVLGCFTVYDFSIGLQLSWALALRLPAEVTLNGPDQVELGTNFNVASTLNPLNWSGAQYSGAGLNAEGGNEWVARVNFFAGVSAVILEVNVCPGCNIDLDVDASESFTTPFGPGSSFPIPDVPVVIPLLDLGFASFKAGINIDPTIAATNITADWETVPGSDCVPDSGEVTFTAPGIPANIGPIKACNLGPTDQAQVRVDNFKYHMTDFSIEIAAIAELNLFSIGDLFGGATFGGEVPLIDFNLAPIIGGLGLYLPDHVQCSFDFSCAEAGPDNSLVFSAQTVDLTPPETLISLNGTAGDNGWWVSNVEVTLEPQDGGPEECGIGIAGTEYSFDGVSWIDYTGPFVISDEGTTTVWHRSMDNNGNVEVENQEVIQIDKTPPVITGAPTVPANVNGWWNTDVTVHFDAFDLPAVIGSGLAFVTPDVVVSTEGLGQSVMGTARDVAGWESHFTVMDINIDKTPPSLVIHSPEAITYANVDPLNADWTAADTLSGIASETGTLDGGGLYADGDPIDLLLVAAGEHVFSVDVMDMADNLTSDSVTFFVSTDINGLIAALEHMCELGLIDNPGICTALMAKLQNAKTKIDNCQLHVAVNMLEAFMNQLDAQNGKHVGGAEYNVLFVNAEFVINNLPDCEPEIVGPPAPPDDAGAAAAPANNPGNPPGNPGNPNPGNPPGNPGNPNPGNPPGNPGNPNPGNPPGNPGNPNPGNPPGNPGNPNPGNPPGNPGNPNPGNPPGNPGNNNGNGN